VEPGRFLVDLQQMGATVSVQGAPELATGQAGPSVTPE
jgi:hypothetical protein